MLHCSDNKADRDLGQFWERQFCVLAAGRGFVFTPLQIKRDGSVSAAWLEDGKWKHLTLPDVTVWTAPGQHHEIKHKDPTRSGCFGLEGYRFHALLHFAEVTHQDVMYTIHNHSLCGGRDAKVNRIEDWLTTNVRALNNRWEVGHNATWINGKREEGVKTYYWPAGLWQPLPDYWDAVK